MTLSSNLAKAVYVTSSAVTDYAYPFKVFHAAQLKASVVDAAGLGVQDLVLTLDYGVSGVGNEAGGALRLTAAGKAKAGDGNKLVILRNMEFTQETDYRPHDIFPAETHERALDILTMMCQELREILGRAIVRNPDEDLTIPYHEIVAVVENMEAYRDQAAGSAEASAKSAGESKQAAAEAKTARTQAQTARAGAEAAQGAAETAAGQAGADADNALTYRDQARQYAAESANSAAAAAGSAASAGTQADNALDYRNQARQYAGNAAGSAAAAKASETNAAGSAAAAKISETSSAASAASANTDADKALACRDQARGFAADAADSAVAAAQAENAVEITYWWPWLAAAGAVRDVAASIRRCLTLINLKYSGGF